MIKHRAELHRNDNLLQFNFIFVVIFKMGKRVFDINYKQMETNTIFRNLFVLQFALARSIIRILGRGGCNSSGKICLFNFIFLFARPKID